MSELVFFLEEPSAEALLSILVPPLVPKGMPLRFVVFEGKQDLERQIVRRMRGYLVPKAWFVVLRDQDAAKCEVVKQGLRQKCREAGQPDAVIRIACRELESWYLGDLAAVERGLGVAKIGRLQNSERFRAPDAIRSPSIELKRLAPAYQKIGGSRAIAPYLDVDNQRSRSFAHFVSAIRKLASKLPAKS